MTTPARRRWCWTVCAAALLLAAPGQLGASPRWAIGLKAGYFVPDIAGWEEVYGGHGGLRAGLSLGWLVTQQVEIGLGGGYFSKTGSALTLSGVPTGASQRLTLIPLEVYLTYRLIRDPEQWWVPYLGAGYRHVTFRQRVEEGPKTSGGQEGFHLRAGLQMLLDRLDPRAAASARQDWGLENSYFYAEAEFSRVDDFGRRAVDLGGWFYAGGLRFEF